MLTVRWVVLLSAFVFAAAAQTKSFSVIMRYQNLVGDDTDRTFDHGEIFAARGNRLILATNEITEGAMLYDYDKLEVVFFNTKAKIYRRVKMGPQASRRHLKTAARTCWFYFPYGPCTDGPVLQGFRTQLVKPGPDTFEYVVRELDWFAIRRENRNRGKLLSFHAAIEVKILDAEPVFRIPDGLVEEADAALYEIRSMEARGQTVTPEMREARRDAAFAEPETP